VRVWKALNLENTPNWLMRSYFSNFTKITIRQPLTSESQPFSFTIEIKSTDASSS